ncbi:MAG: AEC family transporter [Rhodobiaceae bacterium]|nr:AEC family transporter [Rhodobiaceae bacterium]MCC0056862.1 AEC family transporter [Rhodobiaceae bacterium]
MDIYAIANIVLPVFGLIGLGYLSVWTGFFKPEVGDGLAAFVFNLAIPVLLFKTLATVEFGHISPLPLFASYFFGLALVWFTADLVARRVFGRDGITGIVAGFSAGFSNMVLLGIPLALVAFGPERTLPLFLIVSVQLPLTFSAAMILRARRGERDDDTGTLGVLKTIGRDLIRNPIVITIVSGALWGVAGLPLGGPILSIMDKIAVAAVPCALFAMGMGLRRYGIAGNIRLAVILSVLKLFAVPGLFYLLATRVFMLPPDWVIVGTMGAACPAGVNAWLIANHFGTGQSISASTITMTAAASIFTISGWLIFLTG